jgi:SAM-dependent methyltransferase
MAFVDSPDCYCRNKDSPHERKRHKPCLKLLAYEMGVDLDPYEHICDVLRKKICSCSGSETYNDMKNMTYASFENRDFKMPGWRNTVERLGQFGCEFKGKRILDIGCNCGAISLYLQELGASVTGMEINQERVDMAKEMNRFLGLGAKFRNENIENTMGTHWENYDLVVCLAVTGRTACEGKILRKISEHAKEICFESNNCGNDEYARTLSNLGFKAKKVGETNGFPHRVSYYGTK